MARLTPEQLQQARKASGRLGGRPRRPTQEEARREDRWPLILGARTIKAVWSFVEETQL